MKMIAFLLFLFLCLGVCAVCADSRSVARKGETSATSSSFVLKDAIRKRDSSAASSSVFLKDAVHQSAPCEANDITCWCMKAVKYTNDVRKQAGMSNMLKVGSESQLANANGWAEKLARQGSLDHQNFDAANREIGCGRSLGGENVAYNFESGDVARACVDQWIDSQGHYENMVRDWFEEVVVGFAFDSRGAVFCVQTFAVTDGGNGRSDGRGCGPVDSTEQMKKSPEPEPAPVPVSEPTPVPEAGSDMQPKETPESGQETKPDNQLAVEPDSDCDCSKRKRYYRERRKRYFRGNPVEYYSETKGKSDPSPDANPEAESNPSPDANPEAESNPSPDPSPDSKSDPSPDPSPDSKSDPSPDPSPDPIPDSPMTSGDCDKKDFKCWCMKAVKYTNNVRKEAGMTNMLKIGSESQLANANKWAKELADREDLEHQNFDSANGEIGCGRSLGGENVAYNFESGDVARACVDQWIDSQGHYENMVRDWFEEVVVGFAYDSRGAVFCVQTFAVMDESNGRSDGRGCDAVSSSEGMRATPEPVSAPISEPSPQPPASEPAPVPSPSSDPVEKPSPDPVETPSPVPVETPNPDPVSEPSSGSCEKMDTRCWCMKAVKYTNDVRRRNGVGSMLKVGTESQLENANKFAEQLSRQQSLEHQNFDSANREIGCGRALGGENVAYNFDDGDYARACVDQWIGSQGHYENMVRDWFEEVVVGFAFDNRGAVYCVQTFAVMDDGNGSSDGRACEPVQM